MAEIGDPDFLKALQDMMGMDEDAVENVIERLDSDDLTTLNDAVANNEREKVEQIVASVETDETINKLFRGDLPDKDEKKKTPHKVEDGYGYKFGDDVQVQMVDPETNKVSYEDGTVYLPNGPGGTVGVKIQGKSKMVKRDKLSKLDEHVMGMVGVPNLERMQQLAGITPEVPSEVTVTPAEQPAPDQPATDPACAAQQAMTALDVVQSVLPNVRLADLKAIRQRLLSLQTAMNESVAHRVPSV